MESNQALTGMQVRKGRANFNTYQALNGASFPLINGSIITLLAIQLGADATFIGLISSLNYLAFILVYFGRILEPRIGAVPLYYWAWLMRNIMMLPILSIPIIMIWGNTELALSILLFSSIGFNLTRGPGMGANNSVVSELSTPKNRASYLSLTFMLNFGAMILATVLIGLVLRFNASTLSYTLLIALGIALGFLSCYYLFILPRAPKSTQKLSFFTFLKNIFGRADFRIFAIVFFFISFVTAATRPFIVVYMRDVYYQNDSNAILFTVAGLFGAFLMSAFSKTIVQTVGAKTLFIFFTALSGVSLLPAAISPNLSGLYLIIFLSTFNFLAVFGLQGIESTGQTYLFGIIKRNETMDAFILFFMIFGLGGSLGSFTGGQLLNTLQSAGIANSSTVFRIFFGVAAGFMIPLLVLMSFLKNTNKTSVRTGLSLIINPRDIQAISLANRLGAATPSEIGPILEQISRLESDAAVDIIVESLQSPKFEIRRKALATLENISSADQPPELTRALLQQLRNHPFSTAHVAARILGQHQISQAIPSLRRAVMSEDYRLKAEAITALGNLKDSSAILLIKRQIYHNNNHYVLVSSIQSLTTLLSVNDMYVLLWPLSWQKVEPTILNESILGAAKLLGILDRFYHRYLLWLHNQPEAYNELKEVMQAQKKTKPALKQSLEQIIFHHASQLDFMQQMRTFIQSCSKNDTPLMQSMLRICQNPLFTRYASLRFFMIYLLIWQLEEKKL